MPLVYSCDTVKSETLERSKTLSVSRSGLDYICITFTNHSILTLICIYLLLLRYKSSVIKRALFCLVTKKVEPGLRKPGVRVRALKPVLSCGGLKRRTSGAEQTSRMGAGTADYFQVFSVSVTYC